MDHIIWEVVSMHQFSFMLPPLLGLFVGYVTNSLAVRMLFKPYKAIFIWKFRIPFTPGVIPKRQRDLGIAMGNMIQNHLLTATSIRKRLASPSVKSAILRQASSTLFNEMNDKTIHEIVQNLAGFSGAQLAESYASSWMHARILNHIKNIDFYTFLRAEVNDFLSEHLDGLTALLFGSDTIDTLVRAAERKIQNKIDTDASVRLQKIVDAEIDAIFLMNTDDILEKAGFTEERVYDMLAQAYDRALEHSLLDLIAAIDVAAIVENEIVQMDVRELESLIISIMKRELREIINLGGLIGFVLGVLSLAT